MAAPDAEPRRPRRVAALLGFVIGVIVVVSLGLLLGSQLGWFAATPASGAILDTRPKSRFSTQELQGQTIYYVTANCASCHGGPTGGDMMDYPPRHNSNGHTWHHPECELKQIIREGGDEMTAAMRDTMAPPGAPKMLPFKDRLSDADIDAVLAYIRTMWFSYQQDAQAEVTQTYCGT